MYSPFFYFIINILRLLLELCYPFGVLVGVGVLVVVTLGVGVVVDVLVGVTVDVGV